MDVVGCNVFSLNCGIHLGFDLLGQSQMTDFDLLRLIREVRELGLQEAELHVHIAFLRLKLNLPAVRVFNHERDVI